VAHANSQTVHHRPAQQVLFDIAFPRMSDPVNLCCAPNCITLAALDTALAAAL
jgi:hypothetical protein